MLGAIEAGGTKWVLALGTANGTVLERHTIPTRQPSDTLGEAAEWFAARKAIGALGIASFGPVERDRTQPGWGRITDTPKPGWSGCDLAGFFRDRLGVPLGFDTDVGGAALAEYTARGDDPPASLAYVTVGTGIGGGLVVGGACLPGAGHPEMGHFFPRRFEGDTFPGVCPFHGDCLEGLASGPAITARWGASLSGLPPGHPAHVTQAFYLAQLCVTLWAVAAPQVIVLGGGVLQAPGLLDAVRQAAGTMAAQYFPGRARQGIEAPRRGQDAGIAGALLLAADALRGRDKRLSLEPPGPERV